MMLSLAFLAASPRLYMMTPHATAQYGQVFRVSVARDSLNSRTSASAADGENPMSARLEPARVAPETARKRRRVISAMEVIPLCGRAWPEYRPACVTRDSAGTDRSGSGDQAAVLA